MEALVIILISIGVILMLTGGFWFVITSFMESILWGLAVMFLPLADLFFLIVHWKEAKHPFGLKVIGCVMLIAGLILSRESDSTSKEAYSRKSIPSASKQAYSPKPLPSGPNAFTWVQYREKKLQWGKERYLKNYELYGSHSPERDDKAKNLCSVYADYLFSNNGKRFFNTLEALSEDLMALDCTDPFVIYIHGRIVQSVDGEKKAIPLIEESIDLLEASKYPRMYCYFAVKRLQSIYEAVSGLKDKASSLTQKK